jgi:integrase
MLQKMGVNPKVVSERLGHSSVEITSNLYTHFQPDMQEGAALQMEKRFFAA